MKKPSLSSLVKVHSTVADAIVQSRGGPRRHKKMSLYVSPETWRDLQLRKIDEGRDVNAIINDAIRGYLRSGSGL